MGLCESNLVRVIKQGLKQEAFLDAIYGLDKTHYGVISTGMGQLADAKKYFLLQDFETLVSLYPHLVRRSTMGEYSSESNWLLNDCSINNVSNILSSLEQDISLIDCPKIWQEGLDVLSNLRHCDPRIGFGLNLRELEEDLIEEGRLDLFKYGILAGELVDFVSEYNN